MLELDAGQHLCCAPVDQLVVTGIPPTVLPVEAIGNGVKDRRLPGAIVSADAPQPVISEVEDVGLTARLHPIAEEVADGNGEGIHVSASSAMSCSIAFKM
jgi:hypothetical protein